MLAIERRAASVVMLLVVALPGCGGPTAPAEAPGTMSGGVATDQAPPAPTAQGRGASVSVRGETYIFPDDSATTCIVAPGRVSVNAFTSDPRLVLTITWGATGTRHVNFGEPAGGLGVWQAGDEVEGAADVAFAVEARTAEFTGPMRHTDDSIDEATIRVSC